MEAVDAQRVSVRALLGLAWPIVLARATQAVVGFSDALMVAPLGEAKLAAVTTAALDFFTVVMLPMGTVFILQSFASQLRGRGEELSARRFAYYGIAFSVVSGLFGLALLPGLRFGIQKLNYSEEVATPMLSYLGIRMLSLAPSVGSEALGNYFGGLGRTRPAMVAGVLTMVTNLALNYLWISPRFGLSGYGVEGAAWASTTASFVGFFGLLALLFSENKLPFRQEISLLRWREVRNMLRFGLPSGFNYFLEFLAFTLFINVVVGHLGTTVLAAFNVVLQINSLSFMPAFGIASAAAILVGESIGEGKKDRVALLVRRTLFLTTAWMGSVGGIYLLFPSFLFGFFQSENAPESAGSLLSVGGVMLAWCGLWQVFDAISITLTEVLRAAGDTLWPMVARIVLAWLVFTPLAYASVLWWGGGVNTVMASLVVYLGILSLGLFFRYRSSAWSQIELVEPKLPS